jgi:hypothetical protein
VVGERKAWSRESNKSERNRSVTGVEVKGIGPGCVVTGCSCGASGAAKNRPEAARGWAGGAIRVDVLQVRG